MYSRALITTLTLLLLATPAWSAPFVERARRIADRHALARALKARKVHLPAGAHLLLWRIARDATAKEGPAVEIYSLRESGLVSSHRRFWPASSVKLAAAVGALQSLAQRRLDGRARLAFEDSYGPFRGKAISLARAAIEWSSNRAYDRLLLIAGFDAFHRRLRATPWGYTNLTLQCPYGGAPSVRHSPAISYRQGTKRGVIPARRGTLRFARCPGIANCASLLELADLLFRVVLHAELPASARFSLAAGDQRQLRRSLRRAASKFDGAVRRVYGARARVYNKAGRYPGRDHLDVALVDPRCRRPKKCARLLLALSVPYSTELKSDGATARALARIGEAVLRIAPSLPKATQPSAHHQMHESPR